MKTIHSISLAAFTVCLAPLLSSAELYNIQLNGLGTAYSGAAQIGSVGDVWNHPVLTNMDNDNVVHTDTESLLSGAALVDSDSNAGSVTISMTATHYKSAHSSNANGATAGFTDRSLKFDWAGDSPVPSWEITLSGLTASADVNVYVYGGAGSGAGSVLSLNGGTETKYLNDGSGNANDATDAGNQGISWQLLTGTTDGSGNLTIAGRGGQPELTTWWQSYLSGVQIEVITASASAPSISNLNDATIAVGVNITLEPSVSGSPTPAYQWQENGSDLTGETNATLTLSNVQTSQSGHVYSLIATNSEGSDTNSMTLTVVAAQASVLYNVQLNGLGSTYSGAAQVGSSGDVWNNPALSNINGSGDTGSRTVVGTVVLVDSTGTSSPVNLSVSAVNYKGYYATASSGSPVTGLNNQGIKFDYNGSSPVPTVTISLSGLPADAVVGLYVYGAGYNANTAGSTWTMDAGNGGAVGMCGYGGYYETGHPDGLDVTLSSSRNLGWDLVEGTTDGSGNLSVVVTPADASYVNKIWWQTYMNGFQLLVYSAPTISNLVDETVIEGNSTVLNPVIIGVPTPAYQWQENGVDLTGETNATLALNNVQYSQDGNVYSLIASNLAGAATYSMTLSVIVTPTIEGLNNQTAQPGDLVTLAPTVSGVPAPSSQWFYNGGLLSDGATGNGSSVSGSDSDTLSISNAQEADSGTYSLVASNSAGIVTNSMTLTVSSSDVPPEIIGPTDQTEVQGNDATFSASVSGLPVPSLQWRLNGSDIPGETNSSLIVSNVQYAQNGEVYSLVASNTAGSATNSATLHVLVPPSITQQPTNTSSVVGSPAVFSVIAGGVPSVSYQWSRDGSPISGATNSSYSIASVQGSDNGAVFSVEVSNSVDSVVSSNATLTVLSTMAGTFLPTDGAVNIAPDQQLRIVFPSAVKLGDSGVITIHDASDDSVVATIDRSTFLTYEPGNSSLTIPNAAIRTVQGSPYGTGIQSSTYYYMPIAIYGNEVWMTFSPTERLDYGKTYYVNMDAGLLLATDDSAIAGVSDATIWSFSTKASGPAAPTPSTGPTTITIGQDGTGDFATFQGAFDWIPQNNTLARTISVKPGIYRDSATLAENRDFVTIVGEGSSRTDAQLIYPYAYFAPPNSIFTAGSLRIESSDVTVQNLTLDDICYIEYHPTGDPSSGAPGDFAGAVNTVATTGDRIVFDDVLIKGGQDTLYTIRGIAYFNQCEIWGSVDFIYGEALAVFDQCDIVEIRDVGGPVGAPNTLLEAPYGLVFLDCSFPRALVANGYPYDVNVGSSTMMRSWRPDGYMAVINCEMGSQVSTKGWLEWSGKETTCRAREYGTTLIGGGTAPTPAQRQAAGAYWLNTIDPDYTNNPALDPTDPLLYGSPGKDNRVSVTVDPADYTLDAIFGHAYFGLGSWRPSSVLANPPVVLTQPISRAVAQGANVSLTVEASTSTGTTNYLWQVNSNNITAGNASGLTSAILTITDFQAANEGYYYVVVDDGSSSTSSSSALLTLATTPAMAIDGVASNTLTVQIPTEFGPSYLVQTNGDLTTTNWGDAETIVGDGSIKAFMTGVTNSPQLFIRVKVQW